MAETAKKAAPKVEKKVEKKEEVVVAPSTPLQDAIASQTEVEGSVKESHEYVPVNTTHHEEDAPAYASTPYVKGDYRYRGSTKNPDDPSHAKTLEQVRAEQWEQHQNQKEAQAKADAKK